MEVIPTPTVTPSATPGLLCGRSDGTLRWELLSVDFADPATVGFRWRLWNDGTAPLQRADFRCVPGAAAIGQDGEVYDSGLHRYTIDVVGGAHPGIAFVPAATDLAPLSGGESDVFAFRMSRAAVNSSTVLWNSAATADGPAGRMDLRGSLCFQVPAGGEEPHPVRVDDGSRGQRLALALLIVALGAAAVARRRSASRR